LAKITSVGHTLPYDVKLTENDLQEGHLLKESTINCGFIITAHKDIINKRIGKLTKDKLDHVKDKLKELFGI